MNNTGLMLAELAGWVVMLLVIFSPVWIFLSIAGIMGMCS